eukprot:TRINITY_DN4296_c0_g1_i1.p1 TRINITY_DN4296_c0_g1~~TRINITY_DN4296_c0_g1_i1.p1  ORF type:complete len:776 (-),score=154.55 TRINITY_DN4296_c0_g1_i1:78-2336(-)
MAAVVPPEPPLPPAGSLAPGMTSGEGEESMSPGSRRALLEVVDRILRLTLNPEIAASLASGDIAQLQARAQEATEALALGDSGGLPAEASGPCAAGTPLLCSLAVQCVRVVEFSELNIGMARLASAGCEILCALLWPRVIGKQEETGWTFDWVDETLEELSDHMDFLALEIYCGLGRLEAATAAADDLPVVLDPLQDDFGEFWGSIEHRQALEELAAWLLCVVFRALGYGAVTAPTLMTFANHDLLCLCSLLRGLLSLRPEGPGGGALSFPEDAADIQGVALSALCGLTAPELAFPAARAGAIVAADGNGIDYEGSTIEEQNRTLSMYLDVLSAAVVETGALQAALESALAGFGHGSSPACTWDVSPERRHAAAVNGAKLLNFLATLFMQERISSQRRPVSAEDRPLSEQPFRLRDQVRRKADALGNVLENVWTSLRPGGSSSSTSRADSPAGSAQQKRLPTNLRELLTSCAVISAGLAEATAMGSTAAGEATWPPTSLTGFGDPAGTDDGFTLYCRGLLVDCLEDSSPGGTLVLCSSRLAASELVSLAALAANVEDLQLHRHQLETLLSAQRPEDLAVAQGRLHREDRHRVPVIGPGRESVIALLQSATAASAAAHAAAAEAVQDDSPPNGASEPPAPYVAPAVVQMPPPPPQEKAAPAAAAKGLRDVVQNAPKELRCALDGKLLCDPVVSPGGYVFERATLVRWIQKYGPTCPFTNETLTLEGCRRAPEIRKRVTEWVRTEGRKKPKKER